MASRSSAPLVWRDRAVPTRMCSAAAPPWPCGKITDTEWSLSFLRGIVTVRIAYRLVRDSTLLVPASPPQSVYAKAHSALRSEHMELRWPTDRIDYVPITEREPLPLPDGARLIVWPKAKQPWLSTYLWATEESHLGEMVVESECLSDPKMVHDHLARTVRKGPLFVLVKPFKHYPSCLF